MIRLSDRHWLYDVAFHLTLNIQITFRLSHCILVALHVCFDNHKLTTFQIFLHRCFSTLWVFPFELREEKNWVLPAFQFACRSIGRQYSGNSRSFEPDFSWKHGKRNGRLLVDGKSDRQIIRVQCLFSTGHGSLLRFFPTTRHTNNSAANAIL